MAYYINGQQCFCLYTIKYCKTCTIYFGFLNNFEMDLRYYRFDTFDHPLIF